MSALIKPYRRRRHCQIRQPNKLCVIHCYQALTLRGKVLWQSGSVEIRANDREQNVPAISHNLVLWRQRLVIMEKGHRTLPHQNGRIINRARGTAQARPGRHRLTFEVLAARGESVRYWATLWTNERTNQGQFVHMQCRTRNVVGRNASTSGHIFSKP